MGAAGKVSGLTVGEQSTAQFWENDYLFSITLHYTAQDPDNPNTTYISQVVFQCREQVERGPLVMIGNLADQVFQFEIETKYACLNYQPASYFTGHVSSPPPEPGPVPLSWPFFEVTVSAILAILFVVVASYFVFGILTKRFAMNKRGSEMLPNDQFWKRIGNQFKEIWMRSTGRRPKVDYEEIK